MALDSIRGHKFRSFLTVLGIVIGVFTAIVIASLLTGMRQSIVSIIEDYGTSNICAFHLSTGPRTGEDRSERLAKAVVVADARSNQGWRLPLRLSLSSRQRWLQRWLAFDDNITYQGHNYRWGNTQGVTAKLTPTS